MSLENVISVQITDADKAAIKTKLQELSDLLKPYVVSLTPAQRKARPKIKNVNPEFVRKAINYTKTNPEYAPPYLDAAEMEVDFNAFEDLTEIINLLTQTVVKVDDTRLLSGSESYVPALAYYQSVKAAAKANAPGAKAILEDLRQRFEKKTVKSKENGKSVV